MVDYIAKMEAGQKILISEILKRIPTDDVLLKLFPDPYSSNSSFVTGLGLKIIKFQLEGLSYGQIAEKLQLSVGQVGNRSKNTLHGLKECIHNSVEVDIPALRKRLGLKIVITGRYTKLSELLRDMPSDEELFRMDDERGNTFGSVKRHRIDHRDLYILQQRLKGRTYGSIAEEFNKSPNGSGGRYRSKLSVD